VSKKITTAITRRNLLTYLLIICREIGEGID